MKKIAVYICLLLLLPALAGCKLKQGTQILATTKPIYQFASILCEDTPLQVDLLISENVSCLHDYTLQVNQMQKLESAEIIIINGAGFEDFLTNALPSNSVLVDCSNSIALHCGEHNHHDDHDHEQDPHIWLSIKNAKAMAGTIYSALCNKYPQYTSTFENNLQRLNDKFDELESQALSLQHLQHRELITFHDGFSYLAESFDLHILKAIEEDAGSEASAKELIDIINIIEQHDLPAIFTEVSNTASAAKIIQTETGIEIFELDMGLSDRDYFEAMSHNINALKEALG